MSQPATAGSVKITPSVNDAEPAACNDATAVEDPRAPQNWAGPCTAPDTPQPVTDMVAKREHRSPEHNEIPTTKGNLSNNENEETNTEHEGNKMAGEWKELKKRTNQQAQKEMERLWNAHDTARKSMEEWERIIMDKRGIYGNQYLEHDTFKRDYQNWKNNLRSMNNILGDMEKKMVTLWSCTQDDIQPMYANKRESQTAQEPTILYMDPGIKKRTRTGTHEQKETKKTATKERAEQEGIYLIKERNEGPDICFKFRDEGRCDNARCNFRHEKGVKECTNKAYKETGCCSNHKTCPNWHMFDSCKFGNKKEALQRMFCGVKRGLYSMNNHTRLLYMAEMSPDEAVYSW